MTLAWLNTPGVAIPCLEIEQDPKLAYRYTSKGNLVAVVTNGTAVLGLDDIGPLAGKPVMEGKGVLFKRFADIDVFDLELATKDPQEIIYQTQTSGPRRPILSFLRVVRDPLRAAATPSSQSSKRPHASAVLPQRSGDATQCVGEQKFLFAGTRYDRREAVNS